MIFFMLGDVIMEYLENFLNNITLIDVQDILIALMSTSIMILLAPIFKKNYNVSVKKIGDVFKKSKEKYNKNKRFKNCTVNFDDYEFLLSKQKNGQQLSKNEIKCLLRFKEIFDINLINQFSKREHL